MEEGGGGGRQALYWGVKPAAGGEPRAAAFLFTPLLHLRPSALLVLLAVLGVACEDKIVIVELSQLAVETLVALEFLGRRKDTATFGALAGANRRGKKKRIYSVTNLIKITLNESKLVF